MKNTNSMEIEKYLINFKKEIDQEISFYLDEIIKETASRDFLVAKALRDVKKLVLSGGKRLRPVLMYQSYLGIGGKEKKKILSASVSVELVHFFLLIHDDIIDRDLKRHGYDSINCTYQKLARKIFPQKDSIHFGDSMAIVIGDMVSALGNRIIYISGFNPEFIVRALQKLQDITSYTVIGQAEDIYLQNKGEAKEEKVLKMYEYKTAKYTFEGPMILGAILAGAPENILKELAKAAIPLGIAFQIRDDILGIFGSEKKIGKPIGSDIEEGKQTILLVKAREKGDKKQKEILKNIIAKKNLGERDIKSFQKIIQETGALDYANYLIEKKIKESQKIMEKIKINQENKKFFLNVADYVGKREF